MTGTITSSEQKTKGQARWASQGKTTHTVVSTSSSAATLTTVPGRGASKSLHRGAVEVSCIMDAPLESFGPSLLSMHFQSQLDLGTISGTAAAQAKASNNGEAIRAENGMFAVCRNATRNTEIVRWQKDGKGCATGRPLHDHHEIQLCTILIPGVVLVWEGSTRDYFRPLRMRRCLRCDAPLWAEGKQGRGLRSPREKAVTGETALVTIQDMGPSLQGCWCPRGEIHNKATVQPFPATLLYGSSHNHHHHHHHVTYNVHHRTFHAKAKG